MSNGGRFRSRALVTIEDTRPCSPIGRLPGSPHHVVAACLFRTFSPSRAGCRVNRRPEPHDGHERAHRQSPEQSFVRLSRRGPDRNTGYASPHRAPSSRAGGGVRLAHGAVSACRHARCRPRNCARPCAQHRRERVAQQWRCEPDSALTTAARMHSMIMLATRRSRGVASIFPPGRVWVVPASHSPQPAMVSLTLSTRLL